MTLLSWSPQFKNALRIFWIIFRMFLMYKKNWGVFNMLEKLEKHILDLEVVKTKI